MPLCIECPCNLCARNPFLLPEERGQQEAWPPCYTCEECVLHGAPPPKECKDRVKATGYLEAREKVKTAARNKKPELRVLRGGKTKRGKRE